MKGIYEFFWDYGRSGDVESTFIATAEQVAKLIGKDIHFGEILGKHSEVSGRVDAGDIVLKTDDQAFIEMFEEIMGEGWSSGHNPLDYYDPEQDTPDEEDEEEGEDE